MNRSLLRTSVRHVWRRKWQSFLFIVGVALGVAVMVAIDLANGSASRAFQLSTDAIAGKATHQIVGGSRGLDEALYRQIRVDLGVTDSAPIVTDYARVPALDNQPLRLLGVDPFAEAPFRSYLAIGESQLTVGNVTELLVKPNTVLLAESLAQRYGLAVGDTLDLQIGPDRMTVEIVGLVRASDDISRRALEGIVLADIATAQELLDMTGRLSHIDLLVPDATTANGQALLAKITAILPPGATIEAPTTRSDTVQQMSAAFELNLTALSLLALVVGMFLIYNTVAFSVIQRRPVLGTLRALGVTRREIFLVVLGEALVLGLVGTLLGLGLGIVLGRAAVGAVTQTVNDLFFVVTVRSIDVPAASLVKGFVTGLAAALLAAALPALEATSVPPVGALRRSTIESRVRRSVPWLTMAGGLIGLLALVMLWLPTHSLVISFASLFALVLAFTLITPAFTLVLMAALTPLTGRLLGLLGRLGPRTVSRELSRTSVAIAALMVAVSVIIGVSLMISSFRSTVEDWLRTTLQADIFVSSPSLTATQSTTALPAGLAAELMQTPGVTHVVMARNVNLLSPDLGPVNVTAVTDDVSEGRRRFLWAVSDDPAVLWQAIRAGSVVVSEPFVNLRNLPQQGRGYVLRLQSEHGVREFPVAGVYYDYTAGAGNVIMDDTVYRAGWDDDGVSSLGLFLAPGQDVDRTVQALQRQFGAQAALLIRSNAGLRTAALVVFDRAFAITASLQLLATVVAFIGVLSALLSLQIERTRELGILRATGLTRRQVWGLTLLETGLMGSAAGLLAAPGGLLLAVILIYVINLRSFGWTLLLQVEPRAFVQAFAVALIAALLAGIYPAWRQGRIAPAVALRGE